MPVSAIITVNFTSFYIGTHNVYWRYGTVGPYTGPIPVSCFGNGNPCSTSFLISVDNETCTNLIIEGYVQASCEEGTDNQIPFTYTFTPTPSCTRYEITCETVPLLGFDIVDGGSGYTIAPSTANGGITISGGGGSGVVVTANLTGGVITGFTFSNYGSGYVTAPLVVISPPPVGDTASVTALLGYCEGFIGFDCNGSSENSTPSDLFQPGEVFNMCKVGAAPVLPDGYDLVENGNCLCDCTNLTLTVTSMTGSVDYGYTTCDGSGGSDGVFVTGTLNAGDLPLSVCIVVDSLYYQVDSETTTVTATYAPCGVI
jgi:hypothetical protein